MWGPMRENYVGTGAVVGRELRFFRNYDYLSETLRSAISGTSRTRPPSLGAGRGSGGVSTGY